MPEVRTKLTNESGTWEYIPLTDEEIALEQEIADAHDLILDSVRSERISMLSASDWTDLPNAPLTAEKAAEWQTYRDELRDYPAQSDRVSTLPAWPTPPS